MGGLRGEQALTSPGKPHPVTQGNPPPDAMADAEALYDTLRRWLPQQLLDRYITAGTIVLDADQERAALITALEYWRGRAEWAGKADALGEEILALKGELKALQTAAGDAPRAVMGASGDRRARGLYRKFDVIRTDGTDAIGGKHHGCNYFVLDVTHDPFAIPALSAYADACQETYPALAGDLRELIGPQLKERSVLPDIELVAAAVHDAWMQQKRAKGITSAPSQSTGEEQMRPYAELSNEVQEYDRATVRAVYEAIERAAAGVGGAPEERLHESRSPDGDGLPMIKGLGDERAVSFPARGDGVASAITPQQARVHAREGADRNDAALLKPAAGSEPADSQPTRRDGR